MMNMKKRLNLTVVLPDNRILLKRNVGKDSNTMQWALTEESYIGPKDSPVAEATKVLAIEYKVSNSVDLSRCAFEIEQFPPVQSLPGTFIVPVIAKIQQHLNFITEETNQFRALHFSTLLSEITESMIKMKSGNFPKHTPVAVHTARAYHEGGTFGV